ncbi:amino acid/polyamine/organocation transporter (APC superfamily) [Kribbella rubisoli]|uniref:Amino acid/polyamine/organocation transporter (APC superfamily) n=1 Tax=Kribbella rubisoli TaxID=3075929 RepID=A0A4Q7VXI2_9ACTN|nr:APC family permease [Kribbella rubisoli]RZU01373.1 amino acid/polyamine/organocation transporter (APC superfamily) [Kribbella rubisoli]
MTPALGDLGKRLLLGRKLRSTQLGETLLPKRIALPVFASDALSSVAYAPDEVFLTLSIAGLAAYSYSWKIGLLVAFVMLVVVASYRQNVHAYPSGGGDYEVATVNIGPTAGLTVASALMVDYVLTVAVSISSGVQNAKSALPFLEGHEVPLAVGLVLLLTAMNLRGVRESGAVFAVPTYIFMFSIIGMAIWGLIRLSAGNLPMAESANFEVHAESGHEAFTGLAAVFLLARAFSSGCAALTGVEAISNGVPAFRKPKSKNAATTLLLLGTVAVTMLMSILFLASKIKLRYAEDPATQLYRDGQPVGDSYTQKTVIGQIGDSVFSNFQPAFYLVIGATMLILVLAANTAFNGFPVLGSILARDGYLPRQLHTRGDRLAYSNGIILLALCAAALIIAFDAQVTKLIQLYIVGVFVSFTLSQFGMIRHWTRHLKSETDAAKRRQMMRSRIINAIGLTMTGVVLIIVLLTKFTHGAYIAIIAMGALFLLMKGIHRHYETVRKQMTAEGDEPLMLPSRVHSIVLVSKLHRPTLRALAFAKAARPSTLEAITVDVDRDEADELQAEWEARGIPIPLKRLASPYREITRPILQYVRDIRRQSPRDVVMVYIPEYVVGHWWEHILHNQSALRLKGRLLFTPGVMVTSVPYQLLSSQGAEERQDRVERVAGQVRRGARKASGDR